MKSFWTGFEKRAEEDRGWLAPALGAAAAGLGTYGALRGSPKTRLVKTLLVKKRPTGAFSKMVDRVLTGADEVKYIPYKPGMKPPKKPQKVKGTVLHGYGGHIDRVRGDQNIGGVSLNRQTRLQDKLRESDLLNKVAPEAHMPTAQGAPLRTLGEQVKGDYLLKHRQSANSGVGGASFLTNEDVNMQLAGRLRDPAKRKLMKQYTRNPSDFIQQQKAEILKTPFTNKTREMRMHVIDGKVVRGASSPRSGNIEDYLSLGEAEKALQSMLDKMPESAKKNLVMAPDVAMTSAGPKILELNRGAHRSGLSQPQYLWNRYKNESLLQAAAAAAGATKTNQAIYKHITGRDSALSAGTKALGAGLGTGAFIRSRQRE